MKNADKKPGKLISFIIILAEVRLITGCESDMSGGDPIDEKTVDGRQPDEPVTI